MNSHVFFIYEFICFINSYMVPRFQMKLPSFVSAVLMELSLYSSGTTHESTHLRRGEMLVQTLPWALGKQLLHDHPTGVPARLQRLNLILSSDSRAMLTLHKIKQIEHCVGLVTALCKFQTMQVSNNETFSM